MTLRFFRVSLLTVCVFGSFALFRTPTFAADSIEAKALFRDPPREYSTGPLWVWNDLLTDEQVLSTLRDLAKQNVKQVWVHPRPGLMTPYLSADWFRLWKLAVKEAQRLDMNVWIYDENSYPSGFAGGFVPEAMPESRGRGLSLKPTTSAPKWTDDKIAVYRRDGDGFTNISSGIRAGEALPDGQFLVASEVRSGNSPWHGNRCYVNLLSPGVTEKFLELTLEAYRKNLGAEFGRRIPGVFTDEPNIRPADGLPWSEVLPAEFKKRWGYDLLDHLPSLTAPVGDWMKIRHNYFEVLNEQFIEHWSKPYHDYCETNHLDFTGHYWDHEWPNCSGVPDNMAMYAWHQRPAIDCLMNQYAEHTHAQFGNVRMVKELSSIANQLGMPRTLCEVYGAGGWDLRFEDMKRIGDWLEVLGVNTLNQHLSYVTLRGARKRDHPQSFSYHEPWWEAYHVSAQYLARLSAALCQGQQINPILVLEPTTTAWMYQGEDTKLRPLGDAFFQMLMSLEAAQIEYDLGCEDVLNRHGRCQAMEQKYQAVTGTLASLSLTQPGTLQIGRRSYSTIIIPPLTETLNSKTVDLLEQLLALDPAGKVLCLGEPPKRVDGAVSARLEKLSQNPHWQKLEAGALAPTLRPLPGADFAINRDPNDRGILFHHRRQLPDGDLVLLVNTSIEAPSSGRLVSRRRGVEQWDLYSGTTEPYVFQSTDTGLAANFELPPSGSLLLFLPTNQVRAGIPPKQTETTIASTGEVEIHRLDPNVLTLDFVDVSAGGESLTNVYFYKANQFVWKKNGMDRDPWDSAVQYKDELISKKFPDNSGFSASYHFSIQSEVPTNLAVVIERPDLYSITCNGQAVLAPAGEWWLDKAFGRIPIAAEAHTGDNVVTIKASPFTMFHELEPAYLLGNFSLQSCPNGFSVAPEHSLSIGENVGWNAQGCPFYSGRVAYKHAFLVHRAEGIYKVQLPAWKGSVAKLVVNGKDAGYIDAPPWESEVTRWVKNGKNVVEIVVFGTLKNTLGPHHGKPALGTAWPGQFQQGPPVGPPPGEQYSTVAYGLFKPLVLKQSLPSPKE